MNRLIEYLPRYLRDSKPIKELSSVEKEEFDRAKTNLTDIENQIYIDTATWGLAIYEKELGIPINPDMSLEDRRFRIKSKWRGQGKVDNLMLESIVRAYTNIRAQVTFNGRINILFKESKNVRLTEELRTAINSVKPAHLAYDFEIKQRSKVVVNSREIGYKTRYKLTGNTKTASRPVNSNKNKIEIKANNFYVKNNYQMVGGSIVGGAIW